MCGGGGNGGGGLKLQNNYFDFEIFENECIQAVDYLLLTPYICGIKTGSFVKMKFWRRSVLALVI